jgi:predicted Zn finger-like uncharacterized protein
MDVRCERCKTLYELDEARVSESGTAVRCTTCGHVFRVRKTVLLVTESGTPADASSAAPPPVAEKPQWRVRSPTGKVVAFRELTSLQKWIAERKFGRDDEISLRGDTWKRLGDIAELQPFFALLDEVDRVRELEARLRQAELPAVASPLLERELTSTPNASTAVTDPRRPAAIFAPEPETEPALRASTPMAYAMSDPPRAAAPTEPETPAFGRAEGLGVGPGSIDDWEPKRLRSKAPWVAAFLILAAGAAAAAAYYRVWLPSQEQQRLDDVVARIAAERQESERRQAELREREQKAKEELVADLARADAGAAADAGASSPRGALDGAPAAGTGSGTRTVQADAPSSPVRRVVHASDVRPRTYEEWMSRGDVDRANQRFQAALEAYDEALALQPSQPEAHVARGRTLLEMGNRDGAVGAFQRALELNPRYSVAEFWLGEAQRRAGRRADAIHAYEQYLELAPDGNQAEAARQALKTLKQE